MTWDYRLLPDLDLKQGLNHKDDFDKKLLVRGDEQEKTASVILHKLKDYPGIVLGDEVGMGKTWVALLVAISIAEKRPVLVLTPSKVLSNQWKKQFLNLIKAKFKSNGNNGERAKELGSLLRVFEDFTDLIQSAKREQKGIFICSIGSVIPDKYYASLDGQTGLFELAILDEGHNFKNEFTIRYQIFKTTRTDRNFKEPLKSKMHRIMILTATPFQLGHAELDGVLNIFEATCAPDEQKLKFKADLDSALKYLDLYQKRLGDFEYQFKNLTAEEYAEFKAVVASAKDLSGAHSTNIRVNALIQYFGELKKIKVDLNQQLLKFLIRNTKDKTHRFEHPNPMVLPQEQQLLFFLTEQLGKLKRRHHPGAQGHLAAIESSYGRFNDHLDSMAELSHHSIQHYRALSKKLFKNYYKNGNHPKMEAIAEEAFQNWKVSEKTLVFCFYIKTLNELASQIEEKVKSYIDEQKRSLVKKLGQDIEVFRNNIGISNNSSSLVFKDNLFKISLLPLLKEHNLDPEKFLTVDEDEVMELVKYLRSINFNHESVNFSKLVTAFTYFAFNKFHRRHKKLIPDRLRDDFEYFMDPDSLKSMFRRLDAKLDGESTQREERMARTDGIKNYITNLIGDKTRLMNYMTHPTIWEHHREMLEKLDVDIRVKITEIISAYLTGDEYLFLELLPQFQGRPEVGKIPKAYINAKTERGESTYSKVCRFLESASDMAKENLDVLAEEMNYRYQKNKMNAEKVIVEQVSGDDDQYEKIRTVTAFRTPLPPYILLSTSVLAEGVDLHTECRHIVHYDHEWNPAKLEQKTGRVDRVGSKAERLSKKIDIQLPYIKHTQDEKAYRVVMARKSWFDTVMGENYEAKWDVEKIDEESVWQLPDRIKEELRMELDNEAHSNSRAIK